MPENARETLDGPTPREVEAIREAANFARDAGAAWRLVYELAEALAYAAGSGREVSIGRACIALGTWEKPTVVGWQKLAESAREQAEERGWAFEDDCRSVAS